MGLLPQSSTYMAQRWGRSLPVEHLRIAALGLLPAALGLLAEALGLLLVSSTHMVLPWCAQVACCFGHTAEVLRVAWSKDGKLLATGATAGRGMGKGAVW